MVEKQSVSNSDVQLEKLSSFVNSEKDEEFKATCNDFDDKVPMSQDLKTTKMKRV